MREAIMRRKELEAELKALRAREEEIKRALKELDDKETEVEINVCKIYAESGFEALEEMLTGLDERQLRDVIRRNFLDPYKQLGRTKDVAKIKSFIAKKVAERSRQGMGYKKSL